MSEQTYPKKIINYLHYNREDNTIVEPVIIPGTSAPQNGFDNTVICPVRNGSDLDIILGLAEVSYNVSKNIYTFFLDDTYIPDSGIAQDALWIELPFNDAVNGPAPVNITNGRYIMGGDTLFASAFGGPFSSSVGTLTLFGLMGEGDDLRTFIIVWPHKSIQDGLGEILANRELVFGNSCFPVAFYDNTL